jgi:flagellar basal-body rod protein FlgG
MTAQQAWLDSLSNDVSNVNTPGYHKLRVGFRELVDGAGAAQVDLGRSSQGGTLQDTGQPLDMAIQGSGYLPVKLANGTTALTRGGSLQLDALGQLVTSDGFQMVPPIKVAKGVTADRLKIDGNGTVSVAGKAIGKLGLVDVPNPDQLESVGNGAFVATQASGAAAPTTASTIQQGSLETSDVDLGETMVSMIQAERAYDLSSRALKMQDDLRGIANDIRH